MRAGWTRVPVCVALVLFLTVPAAAGDEGSARVIWDLRPYFGESADYGLEVVVPADVVRDVVDKASGTVDIASGILAMVEKWLPPVGLVGATTLQVGKGVVSNCATKTSVRFHVYALGLARPNPDSSWWDQLIGRNYIVEHLWFVWKCEAI
jgi:hypothetical protein